MFLFSVAAFNFWLLQGFGFLIHGMENGFNEPALFYLLYLLIGAALSTAGCYTAVHYRPQKPSSIYNAVGTACMVMTPIMCAAAVGAAPVSGCLYLLYMAVAYCYTGSMCLIYGAGKEGVPEIGHLTTKADAPQADRREKPASPELFREIFETEAFTAVHVPMTPSFRDDLRTVRHFLAETLAEDVRISPYIIRQSAELLSTYRRIASHAIKTEKTFAAMEAVEKSWHEIAGAMRNLYDQQMENIMENLETDIRVLLYKCATEGLLSGDFEPEKGEPVIEGRLPNYEGDSGKELPLGK